MKEKSEVLLPEVECVKNTTKGSEPQWTCPRCGKLKSLSEFGLRNMKSTKKSDSFRRQSWCKECR